MQGKRLTRLLLAALLLAAGACGGEAQDTATQPEATAASTTPTTAVAPAATTLATTTNAPTTTAAPATTQASTTTTTEAPAFPVTVAGVAIPERPTAIVSLSPTATEMLFAVGAGDQVIAVDEFSNYPAEAPVTELSGFRPNLEAIAAYDPDLVVMSGNPEEIASGLEALGIPVLIHEAALNLDDAYRQMLQVGAATGHSGAAEELVTSIQEEIAGLVDEYADPDLGLAFYHEISDAFFSATSSTFIGTVYALFGLENIADAADPGGYGYPQLSAEYILESDPDIIFYGCAVWCGTSADSIVERPGWNELQAVRNGYLFEVDDDISSRWGPRLIEFVRLIGQTLQTLSEAG
ncbi:ABC transporter substrate-binding protein [Candidatus Spongiisocius sp.]|uniref:ABC transporter substrate-binding protein n=1 Tax=Candidatus Spongiisocius sp. TaxID=3101273 RepID=UPI003B5B397C